MKNRPIPLAAKGSVSYALCAITLFSSSAVLATNGMLMEGYGPEATAMGGAAAAIDNGAAGMANNPATLSLMPEGTSRFDISIGNLRPSVSSSVPAMPGMPAADSGGDSYLMPAAGWIKKTDRLSYGAGIFSQGGMGTEYGKDTFIGAATGIGARSELGIGSVMFPVSYDVSDKLSIGGSIEYIWGGLDMRMGMPVMNQAPDAPGGIAPTAGSFADFSPAFGGSQVLGSASGGLLNAMAPMIGSMTPQQMAGTAAVFDFSDDNDFTGQTSGTGFGGKLGAVYRVSPELTLGASYRAKTAMSDMKGDGSMKFVDMASGTTLPNMDIPGKYTIRDLQLPDVVTVGAAYKISDATTLAADISRINWSDSMKSLDLSFTVDSAVPGLGGQSVDVSMNQNWKDQNVVKLGVAHQVNDRLTLRGGVNLADNPVPDAYMNPLFPAIVENHYTAGFTYGLHKNGALTASIAVAPEVEQTNSNTGVKTTHSQTNLQVMYTHNF